MEHQGTSKTISVYFDPDGITDTKRGCFRAHIQEVEDIYGTGTSEEDAVQNLLTLTGDLANRKDYQVNRLF